MSDLGVLKLGGSVVTEKGEPETVATERLAGLAASVAAHDDPAGVSGEGAADGEGEVSRHYLAERPADAAGPEHGRGSRRIH